MSISIGDRIVKNSGIRSGKSGTVKNILSDGTIAVNFDGENTSRYCDPGSCTVMNSDNFDNTPIDRYVKSLRSKVPDSNLETWPGDKGAFSYYNKPNGKKLILAIGKAKDVIKPIADKFSADYIITPVDYGRGKWGYSIEPRAWAKRGEFKVANAVHNSEFKVGDKVKHAKHGTTGKVIDKDPNLGIYVFWDNGTSGYYKNGDGIIKNSVVHSAMNAKFKIGDKVKWYERKADGSFSSTGMRTFDIVGEDASNYHVRIVGSRSSDYKIVPKGAGDREFMPLNSRAFNADFKVGDIVGLKLMDGGKRDYVIVGKGKDYGWYYVGYASDPGSGMECVKATEFVNKGKSMTVPSAYRYGRNSAVTKNGPHFHGDLDALAEKIVKAVQKYIDAKSEDAKRKAMTEINTLGRTASSLAGGAWVMRDGSVALVDKQPRGATRLMDFVKSL